MLYSLSLPTFSSPSSPKIPNPPPLHGPNPPLYVKFRISHRENLRYLKTLRIIDPEIQSHKAPPPKALDQILANVEFFKSKGFSDADFSRVAFLCPQLFYPNFNPLAVSPIFQFLAQEVPATSEESRGLIVRCPHILLSDVEYILRPTLQYLKQLGIRDLNSPTSLNAHLLNSRVEKLKQKIRFLQSIGFTYEEATEACVRMPSIFGYSIDNNLRPKYEYLVGEMERSVEELKKFPSFFGFSLEERIAPRHLHLKHRNVRIPLNRMLLWNNTKFYKKWK